MPGRPMLCRDHAQNTLASWHQDGMQSCNMGAKSKSVLSWTTHLADLAAFCLFVFSTSNLYLRHGPQVNSH
eukprot:1140194-Pelagomonas_calceolata.AAC.3